ACGNVGGFVGGTTRSEPVRVYVPATVGMLETLRDEEVLHARSGTVFALTPSLRESYHSGSTQELEYVAMGAAALASLRLLAGDDETEHMRRVVVAADLDDVTLRPDLDIAVGRIPGPVELRQVASVHVDGAEAEESVRAAAAEVDKADLGDEAAELAVGDAEDHDLAWYAPQELPFLLELL